MLAKRGQYVVFRYTDLAAGGFSRDWRIIGTFDNLYEAQEAVKDDAFYCYQHLITKVEAVVTPKLIQEGL